MVYRQGDGWCIGWVAHGARAGSRMVHRLGRATCPGRARLDRAARVRLLFGNVTEIHDLSVTELAAAIRAAELSPVEITNHYLDRIDRLSDQVGAFYTVTGDRARQEAAAAEKAVAQASGDDRSALPPLTGIPIPIKDLNMVAGVRMTFGSTLFADNVADQDDYVVAALRSAGIVITGKTATPEFGLPCYTETRIGPPARTPWDLTRSAGGARRGAAAAGAGLAPAAQGSDGGGSIRIPSSVCGLFGIKPTRGRVSGGPLLPDLSGLSIDGPIAHTVADAALLLDAMAGNRLGDMYTLPPLPGGETFLSYAGREPGRLRIGRSLQNAVEGAEVHPECVAAYEEASALLSELGHEVEDIAMPFGPDVVPFFETLWYAMATLAPIDAAQAEQLLPITRYLRDKGLEVRAPELVFAQAYLQVVTRTALEALNAYDAVLSPTLASPPVPVGYFDEVDPSENFERQKRVTPYTALYKVSGQPAVSVPLHWTADGLPIGIMLAGRMGDEATLISLSAQLEAARRWRDRHPAIW